MVATFEQSQEALNATPADSYEIAKEMLRRGEFSVETIASITDLTVEKVKALQEEIEH